MTRQEIGAILQELREKAHKSRDEVAELLGKSAKTVGHWETGYASPDANTLFLLCTIYGADLNEAFGFKPSRAKTSPAVLQLYRGSDVAARKSLLHSVIADILYTKAKKSKPADFTINIQLKDFYGD